MLPHQRRKGGNNWQRRRRPEEKVSGGKHICAEGALWDPTGGKERRRGKGEGAGGGVAKGCCSGRRKRHKDARFIP